jgi:hypothetical protein
MPVLVNVYSVGRTQCQLKSFVESRLVTIRADGAKTALGHFRSIWPEFVVRKCVRPDVNIAVSEYSIAILTVQGPLRLGHSVTFWRGAGLAVTNNAKAGRLRMFNIEHRNFMTAALRELFNAEGENLDAGSRVRI